MKELLRVAPPILLGCLAATCTGQAPARGPTAPVGISVVSDLQYSEASRDRRQNQLDLFLPAGEGPRPLVVYVHGGVWTTDSKNQYHHLGRYLAERGFAAALVDYRLYPFARWPSFTEDVAAACAYLAAHAKDYQFDLDRVFLVAHSAGAQIGGAVVFDPQWLRKAGAPTLRFRGFVGMSGAYDVRPKVALLPQLFGTDVADRAKASPIALVDRTAPPALLVWTDLEIMNLDRGSRMFAARLRALGIPLETHLAHGDHGSYVFGIGGRDDSLGPILVQFLRDRCAATTMPLAARVAREVHVASDLTFAAAPTARPMTLVHPVGPGPLPLLVLAIDDDSATAVLDAARAWAQDGLAVAVVPLAGAVGDAAADQYADALRWLAGRRQQYGFGSCTLCGIGRASAAALQVARVPHLLQDRGLDRRILHGVVAICPDAESLARLPRTAAPPAPPLFGIHDVADTAAIRGFSRLGNDDKVVSLPLPGLTAATAARVLGTVDGPLWPLVLGFATP